MPGGKHGRSATDRDLRREGGSSKPKSPVEASDSLKLLIAVGEGEFDSVPTDYDIYLDNTPIRDASGNYNIPNVKWGWRPGSVDQAYIPGMPSVENETSLNIELRSDSPWALITEFRYRKVAVQPDTLFVSISQSGETADTLAALRNAKELGFLASLAICNVSISSLVRESDLTLLTQAGLSA